MINMFNVLVIIPAYNEEECIISTIKKLEEDIDSFDYKDKIHFDYVVINDCSKDSTKSVLKDNKANFISLPLNLGIGGAVSCGYKYALKNNYDVAIQLDGDGQHDSAYLLDLTLPIYENAADIVIGSRFINKEGFQSSSARRMGIGILNFWIWFCSGQKVSDCTSGYRAVNKEYIKLYSSDYPIDYPEPEAIVRAKLNRARIKEIPVIMKERVSGKSSIRPIHSMYYMLKVSISIMICRLANKKLKQKKR